MLKAINLLAAPLLFTQLLLANKTKYMQICVFAVQVLLLGFAIYTCIQETIPAGKLVISILPNALATLASCYLAFRRK